MVNTGLQVGQGFQPALQTGTSLPRKEYGFLPLRAKLTNSMHYVAGKRPLDLPFGEVAKFMCRLPLHLSPCSQEY